MANQEPTCDLIVLGAGPAGCTAALYAARAGLQTVMLSPTKISGMASKAPMVANWPGQVEPFAGQELVTRIEQQAVNAGAEHVIASVAGVDFSEETKLVYAGQSVHAAPAVVIATGAMAPSSPIPGEDKFQGRGVCYCTACDGPFFRGDDVLVVGDDSQAAEETLNLSGIANSVVLVSASPKVGAHEELLQALDEADNVSIHCGLRLQEITGEDEVSGAHFEGPEGRHFLEAAGIFLYLRGAAPATEFLMDAVETDEKGFITTDELCRTSVPGVYAAGDVRSKQARQMVIAAAEGAIAALAVESQLRHRAGVRLDRGKAKA